MRRMDRYNDENTINTTRLDKNQSLYQNVSNNVIYANITDVTNANAFEINKNIDKTHTTRESYQQMRQYKNISEVPKIKKELEDFNHLYKTNENKVYDINSVLEEARKNRQGKDALDEKRKLKNNNYNILAGINKEELLKYREEKKKRMLTPEEEEIRNLMDTIASKTLAGEIDKETTVDLLSDLMATSMMDKVEASDKIKSDDEIEKEITKEEKELTKELEEQTGEIKEDTTLSLSKQILSSNDIEEIDKKQENTSELKEEKKDTDFYTRSMDLSDKDFETSLDFQEKGMPFIVKFLIFILIVAVIAAAGFFIYQRIN